MAWVCPLTHNSECTQMHGIGPDGGLKHFTKMYQDELGKLGWMKVDNPTRSYYWEYDLTHPAYKQRDRIQLEDESNYLEVEVL